MFGGFKLKIIKRAFSLFLVVTLVVSIFSFDFTVFAGNAANNGDGDYAGGSPVAAAPAAVYSYAINSYVTGTSTAIIPPITGSTSQNGFILDAIAQPIPGYFLDPFYQSPVSLTLTQPYTEINFYYTAYVYTLNFESNGGTPINSVTQNYQTSVVKPTDPVKSTYFFSGWFSDVECTNLIVWPYSMPYQGGTIYAGWTQAPVTLTFNSNSGTAVSPVITSPGSKVQKPDDPTRNFFRFSGWFKDISFQQPITWPYTMPTNATTLYAKWTYTRWTINFEPNGGTTVASITSSLGAEVYPPNDPAKSGYTFGGWYYDNNTFANPAEWPILMGNDGFTLYAKWQPNSVTITYDTAGGNAIAPLIEFVGFSIVAPKQPRQFGYVFSGWKLNGNDFIFTPTTKMPVQDITLTASWTASPRAAQVTLETYKTVDDVLVPATNARAGDVVTVFLSAQTNFYSGSSRFVIMYDSSFFTILGTNKLAITPNPTNEYYANAISGYAGATTSPISEWPATFVGGESSTYKFVAANFTASSSSANSGYPLKMNSANYLYKIRLQVKADAVGSGQIFMDNRWDRSLTNTGGGQYYFYCANGTTRSSSGQSVLNFDTDYIDANKFIELDTSLPPHSYINFNTDGGTAIDSLYGEIGTPASAPVPPVKEGYSFTGWFPTFPENFEEDDITLTAQWGINTYNAVFMVDSAVYASIPFLYGAQITAPPAPAKTGYTFATWSPEFGTMGAQDKAFTALFLINSYLATFVVDGQQVSQVLTEYDAQVQAPSTPQKTGYTFTGWSPLVGNMPAADTTYTAQFSRNTYQARFEVDGVTIATVPTLFGTQIIPPAAPEKPGSLFVRWSPAVGIMGAGDRVFTAVWEENIFDAVFMVDDNVYRTVPTTPGESIVLPQEPQKTGYTFTGWDNVPNPMPSNHIVINATWSINSYTITFNAQGGLYRTVQATYGSTIILPEQPVKQGHTFTAWSPVLPLTMPANNITTNAVFAANSYNAKFMVGEVVYANVPTVFATEIVAPANPVKEGYTFTSWTNVPVTMPANDVEITANFTINTYTATFYVDSVYYNSVTLPFGTVIELPAQPQKTGFTFTTWDFAGSTMPAGNININAIFTKNSFDAIFMVDGEQYAIVETGYGENIQLPAVPSKTGHAFLGWDYVPSQMPNNDVTITGSWSVNSYDAIFMADGMEDIVVPTPYGTAIHRPASPTKAGFYFGGWSPAFPASMPDYTLEFTALWVTQAYNAIFKVEDGVYATVLTGVGAPIDLPPAPSKLGYIFFGWDNLPTAMPEQDVIIDALWISESIDLIANLGSTTIIDETTGIIYGIEAGITANTFIADFVQIVGAGELRITPYATAFGTGTKVELLDVATQTVLKTYYIVIFGDVNGDSLVDAADKALLAMAASYQTGFVQDSAFAAAADLTQDGLVDAFDLNILKAALFGIGSIDQTNPGELV